MIPPFDHNHVLPPLMGDAYNRHNYSPYKCEIMEFCQHFSTSPERIDILKGFVDFRRLCLENGITGRQWIGGPFVEDTAEAGHGEPQLILVTTLIEAHSQEEADRIMADFPEFVNPMLSAKRYRVDHYVFVTNQEPEEIISWTNFWIQYFGHNDLGVWKGMLEIPLCGRDTDDQMARSFLNSL